jgi:hypothetical protein
MLGFRKTKTTEPAPPPFNLENERQRRRLAVLNAERALNAAADDLRDFQGRNYMIGEGGRMVPRITVGVTSNQEIDVGHRARVLALNTAHEEFQFCLRQYAEIAR